MKLDIIILTNQYGCDVQSILGVDIIANDLRYLSHNNSLETSFLRTSITSECSTLIKLGLAFYEEIVLIPMAEVRLRTQILMIINLQF